MSNEKATLSNYKNRCLLRLCERISMRATNLSAKVYRTTSNERFLRECERIITRADKLIKQIPNEPEGSQAVISKMTLLEFRLRQLIWLHNLKKQERH